MKDGFRFVCLCSLALGVVLCLSPASLQAAAVSTLELEQAAQSGDIARLEHLLTEAGVELEVLGELLLDDSTLSSATTLSPGYLLVTLEDMAGQSLWCFFTEDQGQAGLLGAVPCGVYAELYQQAAPFVGESVILAVRGQQGSGTGMYLYEVVWLVLDATGVSEVLRYPESGAVFGWGQPFDREFTSSLQSFEGQGSQFHILASFSSTYSNAYHDHPGYGQTLLSYTSMVLFTYNESSGAFRVDPSASDMTRDQLDGLFHDDGQGFLIHHAEHLAVLAGQGNDMQRDWLRVFLAEFPDSETKAELTVLLEGGGGDGYTGTYIRDERIFDEYVGRMGELSISALGVGEYGFVLTVANPALCGFSLEGSGEISGDRGMFHADGREFHVTFSGDMALVEVEEHPDPNVPYECPMSGEYWRQGAYPPANEEEIVANIREHYAYINENQDTFERTSCELQGFSSEGGELNGWINFTEEFVKKIRATHYGEMGKHVLECWYWDNEPLFCLESTTTYDEPFGQAASVEENRYYFHHGQMVRWLDRGNALVDQGTIEFAQARDRVLEQAELFGKAVLDRAVVLSPH
ncbi:MAG: hypothetical protein D6E12_17110 [Desulfovibrio sp.]|nr:MAG: hypothetical protein D6E12_17110 [Desulfovibrio sp.]